MNPFSEALPAPLPPSFWSKRLYELPAKVLIVCAIISLFIHMVFVLFVSEVQPFQKGYEAENRAIEVTLANPTDFKDSVETLQETAKEPPKDAKFVSERNLKADEDTSPTSAPSQIPKMGGVRTQEQKAQEQKKSQAEGKKIMTLTQAELEKEGALEKQSLRANDPGASSQGFYERLKRGQEFKVTAQESDYAQFINRMRGKLLNVWSPKRLIQASWYQYDEIRVNIGLVLNRQGEISDVKMLDASRSVEFDEEAMRTLRESAPFPNPPRSLIQDDGYVYIPWSFTVIMRDSGLAYRGIE